MAMRILYMRNVPRNARRADSLWRSSVTNGRRPSLSRRMATLPPKDDRELPTKPSTAKSTGLLDDLPLEKLPQDAGARSGEHEGQEGPRNDQNYGSARKPSYVSSVDRRRDRFAKYMYLGVLASAAGEALYLGRNWEDSEEERQHSDAPNGYAPGAVLRRLRARTQSIFDYYNEPAFEKLLPDPLPEPYHKPYTLILDLDDLLIHSSWTRERGWRTAKRPGLDYFLGYLSQYYEVVIFTTQISGTAQPIIQKLDPYHTSITAALFRESARYKKGKYIKDLTFMNRPLSKMIMIDTNPDAYSLQPDNAIPMKKWQGEAQDKELAALIPFLEYIAAIGFDDVRPVLREYRGTDIPREFARREALARKKAEERIAEQSRGKLSSDWILRLIGLAPTRSTSPQLVQDQQRERGQQMYLENQKYISEVGPKMMEEEKKKEEEMLKEMKTSLSRFITEGVPKPPQT